jgi:hypothetical protein
MIQIEKRTVEDAWSHSFLFTSGINCLAHGTLSEKLKDHQA